MGGPSLAAAFAPVDQHYLLEARQMQPSIWAERPVSNTTVVTFFPPSFNRVPAGKMGPVPKAARAVAVPSGS